MIIRMTPKNPDLLKDLEIFRNYRIKSNKPIYHTFITDIPEIDVRNDKFSKLITKDQLNSSEMEEMIQIVRDAWKQYTVVHFLPKAAQKYTEELKITISNTNDIDYSKTGDSVLYITGYLIK